MMVSAPKAQGLLLSMCMEAQRAYAGAIPEELLHALVLDVPAWTVQIERLRIKAPTPNDHGVAVTVLNNSLAFCQKVMVEAMGMSAKALRGASLYFARMLRDKVDLTMGILQYLKFASECSFGITPILNGFQHFNVSQYQYFVLNVPTATGGGSEKTPVTPTVVLALDESNPLRLIYTEMNIAHMLLDAMMPETSGFNTRWDRIARINHGLIATLDRAKHHCRALCTRMEQEAAVRPCY